MRVSFPISACGAFVLALTASLCGAEIKGKVAQVKEGTVEVTLLSELLPNRGDETEVYFEIPGLDDKVHVATGRVVDADEAVTRITVSQASGKIQKGHLVRITSAHPRKKGQVAEAARPAASNPPARANRPASVNTSAPASPPARVAQPVTGNPFVSAPVRQPSPVSRPPASRTANRGRTSQNDTMFVDERKTATPFDAPNAITGTVTMASDRRAEIRSDSRLRANLGDTVEFYIKSSGSNTPSRVATGHITAVDGYGEFDRLSIDVDQADQAVAPGQFVLIKSANPRKRSAD